MNVDQTQEQLVAGTTNPESLPDKVSGIILPRERENCPTCNGRAGINRNNVETAYVYALGRIEPRFPSLAVEKEFAQVTGRTETAGKTDLQVLHSVLTERSNRYLARRLCWVFIIEGLETYILQTQDPADVELLIESLRGEPQTSDIDLVIGVRGPLAPAEMCNGLIVPLVAFTQIYSFDRKALVKAIPKPEKMTKEQFEPAAEELFERIMQLADNAGATDEHRALNYLAVRYPAIYAKTSDMFACDCSLAAVEARPSRLSGVRKLVDVIFSYINRNTDVVDKYFVRVDVTEEFPFLATKLSPYFDR